ncbi:TetR/AcrR family transcriptional regulator [Williamsia deligens]|uniref:TetR/AcrR family transcriptional regulator n=1 Tax=Williamsia deligens TaxID=321325 RepID=A0ABW3G5Y4_9NOCA|nr:TetR/AcrR family transcriptional regulator [Williamsia deligens]MCP2193631.1 transcriptional regulator, TetR family [Williamsia deligens]
MGIPAADDTTPPPPSRTAHTELQTRLLDAAEELFALRGYFGVSVRDITDHAQTRLAAVSDQFGGKEPLFRAVLIRRIQPLNEDRRTRLAAMPTRGARTRRLLALIDAFTEPMRDRAGDPGWDNYFRLIAQFANAPYPIGRPGVGDFNAIAAEFITHLHTLFPDADNAAVHDAYLHLVAATMHTYSNNMRIDSLTAGRMHTRDKDERHRALRLFVEGGITRLATREPPT